LPVSFASVPNSSSSVPISAGLLFGSFTAPVLRFTYMYGIPVGERNAGKRRVPRSSARASSRASPVSWWAERSPPSTRMVISNPLTKTSWSNDRCRSM
jgi:hypothetical protein